MKRSAFKSRQPKVAPLEKKIRASARDEDCTLRFDPICRNRTDTVVYCHSPRLIDGKGMGLKAKVGCYGCYDCHDLMDGRRPLGSWTMAQVLERFDEACAETEEKLRQKGILG